MWCIEFDPKTRAMTLRIAQRAAASSLRALQLKHGEALECTAGQTFKVLLDLRGVTPLDADAAAVLSEIKRSESELAGFRGRAVLCDSATMAMQQRRTSQTADSADRELVTVDELEAYAFLRAP